MTNKPDTDYTICIITHIPTLHYTGFCPEEELAQFRESIKSTDDVDPKISRILLGGEIGQCAFCPEGVLILFFLLAILIYVF